MNSPKQIIETLTVDAVVSKIGVDRRRVLRARYEEKLPALWYDGLCQLAGSDLPRGAFNFKYADDAA